MKRLSFSFTLLFTLLLLCSCSSSGDRFRLEGRFRNLNQGNFYIYDAFNGKNDTIQVRDGRFEYSRPMGDSTLLMLLFPNFSELPIIAQAGSHLNVKGDASHLRETKVTGDKANEELTDFRLEVANQTPPEQQLTALNYVEEHPASPIALYLVLQYFVFSDAPDYAQAVSLCESIVKADGHNRRAAKLLQQLQPLKSYRTEGVLPPFHARDTKGRRVDNSSLGADANVIVVWASWNYESQNMLRIVRRRELAYKGRLKVVSICLDASKDEGAKTLERDSITWPNVCDGLMWQSPVLAQLGLMTVGANIVVDKQGMVVGRNLTSSKLHDKIDSMLK
ncbi:MAG: DUF4369 domain-containing protein [Prevotella sp.]|nr:DUF4369 domain-containing protein [Prevotella sp.]